MLAAQIAGLEAVRAGAGGRAVDAVARDVIEAGGMGERFGHGLGHGVGIEIHEAPRLSPRSEDELQPGDVVTVEPGVYVPGARTGSGSRTSSSSAPRARALRNFCTRSKELTVTG